MDALRLPPGDADVTNLSGGERRRVALCRLLLAPDLLLLDEPTNHLDAESVEWLERHLEEYKGTVVAVTHDRYFLDNVAGWILELDRGHGLPFRGNYSSWLEQKQARLAQEERQESSRQRTIAPELEWVRTNPKGRRTKSKARLANYEACRRGAQRQARERPDPHPGRAAPRRHVIEADGVRKGFGDKLLIEDLSFTLPPAGIVGVIGANGAGKTTLFRMIVGDEKPDCGSVRLGDTVDLAYVDQSRDSLDAEKTVWEEISEGYENIKVGDREMNSRAYVAGFNFKGSDQQKKVGSLSGGERNRVHLAKLLRRGGNVLLLDEPTNDLDIDTLRALEEALLAFPGCAVIISHDRWFLDRVATHVLAFEGDSQVTGSRATSRPTRSGGTSASALRPTARTASPTRSSPALEHSRGSRLHGPRLSVRLLGRASGCGCCGSTATHDRGCWGWSCAWRPRSAAQAVAPTARATPPSTPAARSWRRGCAGPTARRRCCGGCGCWRWRASCSTTPTRSSSRPSRPTCPSRSWPPTAPSRRSRPRCAPTWREGGSGCRSGGRDRSRRGCRGG